MCGSSASRTPEPASPRRARSCSPATEDGAIHLEIGGQTLTYAVSTGDAHTAISAGIEALLPAHGVTPNDYPLSASDAAGTLTLTAKHKGETGNGIDVRDNPLKTAGGQKTPAGITVTITPMGQGVAGATNPVLTTAIAAVDGMDFDYIFMPWTDADSLSDYKAMMNDTAGRWYYEKAQYGHVWTSRFGTVAQLGAVDPNDQHLTMLAVEGDNTGGSYECHLPNLPEEVGAAYMGACANSLRVDPALPCQTLELVGDAAGLISFRAPDKAERFSSSERNTLLGGGVATMSYSNQGAIRVERAMTSYTEDAYGNATELDVQPLYISAAYLRRMKAAIESDFGRSKITATTTREIEGRLVAEHDEMVALGWVTDTDGFAASITVEVNGTDPNRIDVSAEPDYANQLRVLSFTNNFIR